MAQHPLTCSSGMEPGMRGVQMGPGATALQRMPGRGQREQDREGPFGVPAVRRAQCGSVAQRAALWEIAWSAVGSRQAWNRVRVRGVVENLEWEGGVGAARRWKGDVQDRAGAWCGSSEAARESVAPLLWIATVLPCYPYGQARQAMQGEAAGAVAVLASALLHASFKKAHGHSLAVLGECAAACIAAPNGGWPCASLLTLADAAHTQGAREGHDSTLGARGQRARGRW